MRPYMRLGEVPRKRHMRFEVDGAPVYEELFGREGFTGPSSLLYHRAMPEGAYQVTAGPPDDAPAANHRVHDHAHLKGFELGPEGDPLTGRRWLLANDDVRIGLVLPERQQEVIFINGSADEVLFLHRGSGTLHSPFGSLRARQGDYLVIPRGTAYRLELESLEGARILVIECAGMVDVPDRYRARNGQLTEFAPYSERDFRGPERLDTAEGPVDVWLKRGDQITTYRLDHHPFDLVGWDGTVYPVAFNIADFEPKAGRFHQPPPVHQTFAARNLVICSFCPRKLDWDPEAVTLPYHHSNLDSDEVLFYAEGDYAARRGVKHGSFTHHVGGVPHGPQPGALEASFGRAPETNEMAVMIDTFRPLWRTEAALAITDREYPFSWHTGGMRASESVP